MDEKLRSLSIESIEFLEWLTLLSEGKYQVNKLLFSEKVADFYDKNKDRYNETQLVSQFIKSFGGAKMLRSYHDYKKIDKDKLSMLKKKLNVSGMYNQ